VGASHRAVDTDTEVDVKVHCSWGDDAPDVATNGRQDRGVQCGEHWYGQAGDPDASGGGIKRDADV
jgi:hypothetical protein